jgi:hypothetical protein
MSSIAEEFPDFPFESLPPMPPSWEDMSWRNDVSPSFRAYTRNDGHCIRVWIDLPDPDERELCVKRYAAGWCDAEGSADTDHPFIESDDWDLVLSAVLEEMRKSGVGVPSRTTS